MLIRFLMLFFILTPAWAKDICFPTSYEAYLWKTRWDHEAAALLIKFVSIGKPLTPTNVSVSRNCDHCLIINGDPYLIGVFEERYEKIKEDLLVPGKVALDGYKIDVSIGDLVPFHGKTFNPHYIPFLSFPNKLNNTFYDSEKIPIDVSARIVHPKLIEYTFKYKLREHTVVERIDDKVYCMFPYDRDKPEDVEFFKNLYHGDLYMKEEDRFLKVDAFRLKSFFREE